MAVYGYIFLAQEKEQLVSTEEQQFSLQEYAKSRNLSVDEIILEQNVSLKKPFRERKQGKELSGGMRPGDTLIVLRSEWILGSAGEASRLVRMLRENHVSLYCVDLGTNITLDEKRKLAVYEGGAGLVQKLLNALAVCESSKHGDAIRATKRIQKKAGKYLGGPVPFGWEVNDEGFLSPDPTQQNIIHTIVAMREDRWSYRDISRKLREEYGVKLSHEGVRRVLNSNQKRKEAESLRASPNFS